MTELQIGVQGAVRQSWTHDDTLRRKLFELKRDNPEASADEIRRLHWEWVEENPGLLALVHQYWFDNHHAYLTTARDYRAEEERRAERAVVRAALRARAADDVKRRIIAAAPKIALLGMMLPNGKPLRECTGRECERMGRQVGGWLVRVGCRVGRSSKVGDVLNEDDLRRLYAE